MIELPPGWVSTTIGEITAYISRGKSPKYTDRSELPVVNQKAIRWFGIQDEYLKYIHPDQFDQWTEERYIRDGDILWNSTGTGTIGRACLVQSKHLTPPKVVDSHVTIVRSLNTAIDPRYLFAWIRGPQVQHSIQDLATGTTNQIELSRASIANTGLPFAPIKEQKRIADRLDLVLTRVDACRERLDRMPAILKRFRNAVLDAAVSGRLTEDWRSVSGPMEWTDTTIGKSSVLITKGASPKWQGINYVDDSNQTLFITSENVGSGQLLVEKKKYVENEFNKKQKRSMLSQGDVLTNIVGASIGRAAIFDLDDIANINQAVCIIRVDSSKLINKFLMNYLNSPRGVSDTLKGAVEVARANVSLATIGDLSIKLPPLKEQKEICHRVETLFAYADRLDARYSTARAQVELLTPAFLAKAFRGNLVPQDPNDEPASALLERIRFTRVKEAEKHPKKKKTERKHMPTKLTLDALKEIIHSLPNPHFTFDDLRGKVPADYETIKDHIFTLLEERPATVKQVFDKKAQNMRFERINL